MSQRARRLAAHQEALRRCRRCPQVAGPPVLGRAVLSPVLLVGQAPGAREADLGHPFAWTAGRTLFRWFAGIGLQESEFRERVYMAAVCRCFPGKNPGGGDRVPNAAEIAACAPWLEAEAELVRPALILPVGKLAITRFVDGDRLDTLVGQVFPGRGPGGADLIPLPHPSGASTWHRREPGLSLLRQALVLIGRHPAWHSLLAGGAQGPAQRNSSTRSL